MQDRTAKSAPRSRNRYISVMNDGNFLVIHTGSGVYSDIEPSFEALAASVRFQDASE
jgi:hypothetical protein